MVKSGSDAPAAGGYAGYLSAAAARWPGRVGLRFESTAWTYYELHRAVQSAAGRLTECGVCPGTRVLILAENCPEYLIAQFALAHIGAVFVTPNPYWTPVELDHGITASAATAAVFDASRSVPDGVSIAIDIATLLDADAPACRPPAPNRLHRSIFRSHRGPPDFPRAWCTPRRACAVESSSSDTTPD